MEGCARAQKLGDWRGGLRGDARNLSVKGICGDWRGGLRADMWGNLFAWISWGVINYFL